MARSPSIPLQEEKRRSLLHLALALAVVFLGARAVGTPWAFSAFPIVAIGVWAASHAFARLARIAAIERAVFAQARAEFAEQFRRSTLPRQVYWLLLAIAEADGRAGEKEQRLVRDFLLERFPPDDVADIARWHEERALAAQISPLAASLRTALSRSECETVFFWACLVAFADGRFSEVEHEALQRAARALGFEPTHARRIFWHAKHAFTASESPGMNETRRASARPTSEHQRALEILGLDETATSEAIRARHRELVKKFHPDRHAHLGEAAAKEAAARFREVQAAYEYLRA